MSLDIGRKGWVEVGSESSYGVPVATVAAIPFIKNGIKPVSEPLKDNSARGIRDSQIASVLGKEWAEGELEVNLDCNVIGYFLKAAMGTLNSSTVSGSVKDHTFTRNNSNTPASLTMINDRVTDRFFVRGTAVKSLEISAKDDLATAKIGVVGKFQGVTTSGTGVTTSGNVFSFANYDIRLGSSIAAANASTGLAPSEFSIKIENNSEAVFRAGSNEAASVNHKNFEVSGKYTLFFENVTDRNQYYNNAKKAMEIRFAGNGLGSGLSEALTFNVYQMRVDSFELETGVDDFYAEKADWVGEYDFANTKTLDVVMRNTVSTY
jgi:hypothetical protein